MAQLGSFGQLEGAEVQSAPGAIPKGWYRTHITDSEVKANNAGSGHLAAFTLTILEGPMAGRKLFWNINVQHSNPQAQEIGRSQLLTLATNVGHPTPHALGDTEELHGKPFMVLVGFGKGDYADRNEIKGTDKDKGAGTPATTGPVAPQAPAIAVAPAAPVVAPVAAPAPYVAPPPIVPAAPPWEVGTAAAAPAPEPVAAAVPDLKAKAGF